MTNFMDAKKGRLPDGRSQRETNELPREQLQ
jgi:hypothetical protein